MSAFDFELDAITEDVSFEVENNSDKVEVDGGAFIMIEKHEELKGRDLPNQHPISAITGLQEALDSKLEDGNFITKDELDKKQDTIEDLEEIRQGAEKGKNALPSTTKYGSSLSLTINDQTYILTAQLKDQNGENLGTAQTVDLPLETMVVGATYDEGTREIVLTLTNGESVRFSVADLVSGLATKEELEDKQDVIPDLSTIRTGAEKGNTAVQPDELDQKLSYSLINGTPTVTGGNSEISLQDRAITTVTVDDTVSLLTFIFPQKTDGKARDFFIRLVVIGDSIPTLSFIEPNGDSVPFDVDDDSWAEIEQGVNILMFTDTGE